MKWRAFERELSLDMTYYDNNPHSCTIVVTSISLMLLISNQGQSSKFVSLLHSKIRFHGRAITFEANRQSNVPVIAL